MCFCRRPTSWGMGVAERRFLGRDAQAAPSTMLHFPRDSQIAAERGQEGPATHARGGTLALRLGTHGSIASSAVLPSENIFY